MPGIKMASAMRGGLEVALADLTPGDKDLICVGCNARVRFVPEHNKLEGTVHVSRYVGLSPNANHQPHCRFNAIIAFDQLVNEANAATGDEAFEALAEHEFRYRPFGAWASALISAPVRVAWWTS